MTGQTRDGQRGAHGGTQRPIIGFDSKARLADIETELARIDTELERIDTGLDDIRRREEALHTLLTAHNVVAAARWQLIDHESIATQIIELEARKQAILSASDLLQELESQKASLEDQREVAAADWVRAGDEVDKLDQLHAIVQDRLSELAVEIADFESRGVTVSEAQASTLASHFDAVTGDGAYTPEWFAARLARLVKALDKQKADGARNAERVATALRAMFEHYQERWPDANLGTDVASAPDYLEILDEITATGLHERRQEWVKRIAAWTGEDLLPLHVAFDTAIEDIVDRLAPVNAILTGLPFGSNRERLRIQLRRLTQDRQAKFRSSSVLPDPL